MSPENLHKQAQARELIAQGLSVEKTAKRLGSSTASIYKWADVPRKARSAAKAGWMRQCPVPGCRTGMGRSKLLLCSACWLKVPHTLRSKIARLHIAHTREGVDVGEELMEAKQQALHAASYRYRILDKSRAREHWM